MTSAVHERTNTFTKTGTVTGTGTLTKTRARNDRVRAERTSEIFSELAALATAPGGDPSDAAARRETLLDEVVLLNLGVADAVAMRYAARGVASDDLVQVARLALVRAVHGFDLGRECDFLAYAVPSITGAVKRHFRDLAWTVRPPRRVQEAQLQLNSARPVMQQQLGREPTVPEIAAYLSLDEETVIEALAADSCFTPDSLDRPVDDGEGGLDLSGCIGSPDPGFALTEQRTVLAPLIKALPDRDRKVLELRFIEGLTQREVGQRIGVTQMQVSRILARILGQMRVAFEGV
jgi:RNA polymerase sigma-B factor